jgi:myosin heavy subunit
MAEVKDNLLQLDKVVGDLNKRLDENIDKIDRLAVVYNKFSKESANAPSQYVNVLNDTKKAVDSVNESQKKLEQTEKQLQKTRLDELRLQKQREQAFDKYEKQLASENAKLQAASNTYNKLQVELNKLSNTYKDLATRKAQGATLTKVEAEQMTYLEKRIKQHDTTLKAVDATMGKYQRNVGNYAGAFNPLSNSINQLSREMPAFANSVQTGFMAISNNLPIFFDAMGQAIAQQKELQAQGQPSKNALQLLAGSFFTLGTALSVGVTLLTLFGPKLVDAIFNTEKKKQADEAATKALEDKNKAEKDYFDTISKSGSEEISRSKILLENAKNVNMSMAERLDAIKQLKERYPDYLGHLTNEQILSGKTAEAENKLNEALMKRGVAIALQGKLTEQYNKLSAVLINISEIQENQAKIQENSKKLNQEDFDLAKKMGISQAQLSKDKTLFSNLQLANSLKNKKAIEGEISDIFKLYNQYSPYLDTVNDSTKATDKNTDSKNKNKKATEDVRLALIGSVEWFEKLKSALQEEQSQLSTSNPKWSEYQTRIEQVQKSIEAITGASKKLKEEPIELNIKDSQFVKDLENAKELLKFNEEFKKGFQTDFISNSGFSKIFDLIENFDKLKVDGVSTALAISEAFQQAFNTIANASQANFDAEYSRLEQQKEVSMQFAGESAAAKEEIERQYETRKKEIQRREAEAQKRLAMFNIITNTAQAIMAAAPKVPLMIAMGAIGALQLAMVASQQIPQFWKGTDNAPEGLAWTQERGAEVITDSKGNIKTLGHNKGAQLTYLNKGDKVYKSHTDYINKELSKNGIQPIGQSFSSVNVSSGLTADDLNAGIESLKRTISQKENISINIDKKGFKTAVNGKNYINNRLILKGRSV